MGTGITMKGEVKLSTLRRARHGSLWFFSDSFTSFVSGSDLAFELRL